MADEWTKTAFSLQNAGLDQLKSFVNDKDLRDLFSTAVEMSYKYSAAGSHHSQYSNAMRGIDRFGYQPLIPNHELRGMTFITRPKLQLSRPGVRSDETLTVLDTLDPNSLMFAIRALLDTKFSKRQDIRPLVAKSPFFNPTSPWATPLMNCLVDISGWPDFNIDTETSEGGFFGEDITIPRGGDSGGRTVDLTLTFRDIQGGPIFTMLYLWTYWIAKACVGSVIAYPEDIAAGRMSFTCSIYRFIVDPSRRSITKWAKATGCYPVSFPIGAIFNYASGESFVSSAMTMSIPFKANIIEYQKPAIFKDFNKLALRYAPDLLTGAYINTDVDPAHNFTGLPWIDVYNPYSTNQLIFKSKPDELEDTFQKKLAAIKAGLIQQAPITDSRVQTNTGSTVA